MDEQIEPNYFSLTRAQLFNFVELSTETIVDPK